jgi:polyisoprenoid-binding protein YceI
LKADDFFEQINLLQSLVLKSDKTNVYTVTGDLTIKGITKPVTFDLATTANTATTNVIDRTKFDIKYGSGSF